MNRIAIAESSVSHDFAEAPPRVEVLQGKLVFTGGDDPSLSMFMPMHYEKNYSYPLVVWLHGERDDERQLQRVMPYLSMRNYVAIAPQGLAANRVDSGSQLPAEQPPAEQEQNDFCSGKSGASDSSQTSNEKPGGNHRNLAQPEFDWPQTEACLDHAHHAIWRGIERASERCNINRRKVLLIGHGSGASMALRVALRTPDLFQGVVAIGGGLPKVTSLFAGLNRARRLPILLSHGRDAVDYPEEQVCNDLRLFHTAGFNVTVRQYPCGDDLTDLMLKDANVWLMDRVTGQASS